MKTFYVFLNQGRDGGSPLHWGISDDYQWLIENEENIWVEIEAENIDKAWLKFQIDAEFLLV